MFCTNLAQIVFYFFPGFHLPENGMFKPVFWADFWCADFCAHSCADFWCADFLHPFCADVWCADFCADFRADFSSTFWRLKNRCSRVTQKCAENLRKNLRRPNGPCQGGGTPFHLCFLEQTARHTIAASPTYSRRACERPPWHLWAERHASICSRFF